MKNFQIFLILIFLFPSNVFGQQKVSEITDYNWDQNKEVWIFQARDTWDYDQADREIMFTHKDIIISDYLPYNNTSTESIYNNQGLLLSQENIYLGRNRWLREDIIFTYDAQNELTESLTSWISSESPDTYYDKLVYEKEDSENRRTLRKYFTTSTPDHWNIQYQRDSFFNDHNCWTKQTIINYDLDGTITSNRYWENIYTPDCKMKSSQYFIWDINQNDFVSSSQHDYTYSNEDKTVTEIYKKLNHNTQLWEAQHLVEKEVNDAGQEVRYFYEQYRNSYTDTLLELKTYTSNGDLETHKKYKTAYGTSDNPLYLIRVDSFAYHFDSLQHLMKKEQFIQSYNSPVWSYIFNYEYYCNGQLKREIVEVGAARSRKEYRYHGGVNCPLDAVDPPLIIFPNPTEGAFVIHSNLLANPNATVQIFNILGQEIYFEKVTQATYQFQIELPSNLKGQFVVVVNSSGKRNSQMILVQ